MKRHNHVKPNVLFQAQEIEITLMGTGDVTDEYVSWLNDRNHLQYSNQRFLDHSLETCLRYVESFAESPNLLFKISLGNQFVGTSALEIDPFNKVALLGILISPQIKGRGVGKKAWNVIVNEISPTLGLRKVKAGVAELNFAMKNIILSSGMTLESILERDLIINDKESDLEQYAKIF